MMKTTLSSGILLAILMFVSACNSPGKRGTDDSTTTEKTTSGRNDYAANESKATVQYDRLMTSFAPDWEEKESDPSIYPDYYGGSYINDEGKLVICVTGNAGQHRQTLARIIESDDFVLETVRYSYRELMKVMDKIDAFLGDPSVPEDHPVLINFSGAGPDIMENRVIVEFQEINDAITGAFRKDISGSPAVLFKEGEMPVLF